MTGKQAAVYEWRANSRHSAALCFRNFLSATSWSRQVATSGRPHTADIFIDYQTPNELAAWGRDLEKITGHYDIQKWLSLTLTSNFHTIFPATPTNPLTSSLTESLATKTVCVFISYMHIVTPISHPWYNHHNKIRWRIQIANFLVMLVRFFQPHVTSPFRSTHILFSASQ